MPIDAWSELIDAAAAQDDEAASAPAWLERLLARNAPCDYLRRHGQPRTLAQFRERLPLVEYEALADDIARIAQGAADRLFAGRPVAFERTGGSSGGSKLIAYSAAGLADFQRAALPWLADLAQRLRLQGRAYLAISPATRAPETLAGVPVGLPDGAYLGPRAAQALGRVLAVAPEVAAITEPETWRARTLAHLREARDLELISVWSPTFLLRLLDDLPDPRLCWPRLKCISCWTEGQAAPFAAELAARVPQALLQPKGLMSTECIVSLPDAQDRAVLNPHGFFEFLPATEGAPSAAPTVPRFADELASGAIYEVIATTASGLYRYRTGDLVRCAGHAASGRPVLSFLGRGGLCCDLVGEKLTEAFVADCLSAVPGFRFLAPEADGRGYALLRDAVSNETNTQALAATLDTALCRNPQYAYARSLGQLRPVRVQTVPALFDRYAAQQMARGVRLGDVKPLALRKEPNWLQCLESPS